jgi:segregation and condensation protein A
MYKIKLSKFEGPLDLLLKLIEEQKLDIASVSIAKVADDYLEYIRNEKNISLENLSEFVNVASKIILIKSKNILPSLEISPEEEKEIGDLEEQLRLYKKFKDAGIKIGGLLKVNKNAFSRDYLLGVSSVFAPPKNVNAFDLKKYFSRIIDQIVLPEKIPEEAVRDIITLENKISELQETIKKRIETSFSDLNGPSCDRIEIIVSFLAMLELVKQRIISVEQNEIFSEIKIKAQWKNQS